ncbi:L-seryl-tRNA(Sec) selenium transferase [candidate division KSB1 bacterium]|nr:L-seryl-tRNA(Sec) selenium transferase [candidate division KSB1 bacterium]
MNSSKQKLLSQIPQVDEILRHSKLQPFIAKLSHEFVLQNVQKVTEQYRAELLAKDSSNNFSRASITKQILSRSLSRIQNFLRPSLQRAINGTGIILHTGLGRAPLITGAKENLAKVAAGYSNLEIDLESGKRGKRNSHVEELLCYLAGAEAACIVNNNAAAVLLTLNTLSFGKEAIISRGQLVEIGGSFRIPDVMEKSGTKMVEVGTTNKTHLKDYEKAISDNTGVICVVHPSNFRVKGFTNEVSLPDLVSLGEKHNIPVVYDLGGGVLVDLRKYDLPYEPVVSDSVTFGVDVVTFSGDKVLGGPQAGILVGKKKFIDKIKSNPLMRALRCDKLIYAALEPTLRLYLNEDDLLKENCVLKMLLEPMENLNRKAKKLSNKLDRIKTSCQFKIEDTSIEIGSGAMPLEEFPSKAISLQIESIPVETLAKRFRSYSPPIIGYIRDNRLFFDLRTIFEDEHAIFFEACQQILT